jgi:hypothetical protein
MKTSAVDAKDAGKRTGESSATHALKRALNLFGSESSTSNGKTAPLEQPRKRSKETPPTKDVPKSSASKGIFE